MRSAFLLLICLLAALAGAQARELEGGRLETPPTLDGKVEDAEYRGAVHFDGLVDADTGGVAPEGGTFYLGYDARFVYFAARLIDRQPNKIQATEFRTNVSLDGDDSVTLALDPFGALADFSRFTMNPRGATSLQIAGGRAAKREWLGDFASKGRVTPDGWEVEARIPWSVLRLPGKGTHDLRFNVYRDFRRYRRVYAWAQTSNGLTQNYGRWKAVDLPEAPRPLLQLLPYVYGGVDDRRGIVANSGLDLRYPLSRDLDLVGTINPDFRNVERGILSLDFSYFARLADETRPFFREGADYFEGFGDSPIFVPQAIGNFDVGAKAFGKLDAKTDLGVLATDDVGHDEAIVARLHRQEAPRRDWAVQYAGGEVGGQRSDAAAARYGFGTGFWNLGAQLGATHNEDGSDGHRAVLTSEYNRDRSFFFGRYAEISPNFAPLLGFAPQKDYRGFEGFQFQRWTDPKHHLLDYNIGSFLAYYRSYDLSEPFHEGANLSPGVTWNGGLHVSLNLGWDRFFGGSSDGTYGILVERPADDPYRHWIVSYDTGTRADDPYHNLLLGFAYRPLPTFQLAGSFQSTTYSGKTFQQTVASANYDLDPYHSVGGRVVEGPGVSNFYVSFRQAGNRGAEYYVILGDPNAPHFRASLIVKAVFPLGFRL